MREQQKYKSTQKNRTYLILFAALFTLPTYLLSQDCPTVEVIKLDNQSDIDAFIIRYPDCKEISGDLHIGRFFPPNLTNATIKDLSPLANIVRIKGKLQIAHNTNLVNLKGLENLKIIEGIAEIRGGFNTATLEGLENLDTVGSRFTISSTDIENTNDFQSLSYVGESLILSGNDKLSEISIPSLQDIGGYLYLEDNENLKAIKGMEHWTSISGGLRFYRCHALTDLSGLSNLRSIGRSLIFIDTYNDSLLMNLTALDTIHGDLRIVENTIPSLQGLEWIKHIGGEIAYEENTRLTHLLNFESTLAEVKSISIFENRKLEQIDGLNVGKTREQVLLKDNGALTLLDGLSSLTDIGGDLLIDNNRIEQVDGLNALESIGGNFLINNNFLLANLDGLANLKEINGFFNIIENSDLSDISGIRNINPSGISSLQIRENYSLPDCSLLNICNYLSLPDAEVTIENNATGCNAPEELPCLGNRVNGRIFYDTELNALFDNNDIGIRNAILRVEPSGFEYYTNENGEFRPLVEDGSTFTIRPIMDNYWIPTTEPSSYTITQDATDLVNTTYDFGFTLQPDIYEGTVSFTSEPTRCNEKVRFFLQASNDANTLESGLLTLQVDKNSPIYTTIPKDDFIDEERYELVWHLDSLAPSELFEVEVFLNMPSENFIGEKLCFTAKMFDTSNGDEVLLDSFVYKPTVLCSFDPNDKLISPEGVQEEHLTLFEDSILTYTVRFQNTGNAPARHVRILDTLDHSLNLHSFRVIHSSFSPQVKMTNQAVEFYFEDINLPDSLANEPESHGFVTYEIHTKQGLPENTRIENTAFIIFDFNPPIVTNTTFNTMVSSIGGTSSDTDLKPVDVKIFPNPTSGIVHIEGLADQKEVMIKVFDSYGRVLLMSTDLSLDLQGLVPGIYNLLISHSEGNISQLLIIQ